MLLFTGKGGVGKTSVAAATAVRAATAGARVLVTSTDPAHSLADAIDVPLGDRAEPVPMTGRVAGSLHAQQVDAQARLERHWRDVRDYLVALLSWSGLGEIAAEELVLLPGIDELFALIDLRDHLASGAYDLVVVDCAPTAETLRLLALPDALGWYVDRLAGPGRRMARALRPLARGAGLAALPLPDDAVFATVERVHRDLADVHALLQDPARAALRLVCNPERLSVAETERTATTLSLFGYGVDAVVVNRVLPDGVTDPYLARWKDRQAHHLRTIETAFAPTPVLRAPLLDDEVIGVPGLARLADALYADVEPDGLLPPVRPVTVAPTADGHVLRVALPFAGRDEVDLHRRGGDLHLKVAGVRRTVPLPGALRRDEVAGAALRDGWLEVRFRPVEAVAGGVEVAT
ncbi:ArsA family ATPase [Egicoccus sp. AB-alg2]|uniref:ArsA family ATPase n=1 Tax=Egicoccus sp. AB-alg2 TaxID=3242693 RepID=UPI00359CF5F8